MIWSELDTVNKRHKAKVKGPARMASEVGIYIRTTRRSGYTRNRRGSSDFQFAVKRIHIRNHNNSFTGVYILRLSLYVYSCHLAHAYTRVSYAFHPSVSHFFSFIRLEDSKEGRIQATQESRSDHSVGWQCENEYQFHVKNSLLHNLDNDDKYSCPPSPRFMVAYPSCCHLPSRHDNTWKSLRGLQNHIEYVTGIATELSQRSTDFRLQLTGHWSFRTCGELSDLRESRTLSLTAEGES